MFVKPEIQGIAKSGFITPIGMLLHQLTMKLKPELLNGINFLISIIIYIADHEIS